MAADNKSSNDTRGRQEVLIPRRGDSQEVLIPRRGGDSQEVLLSILEESQIM